MNRLALRSPGTKGDWSCAACATEDIRYSTYSRLPISVRDAVEEIIDVRHEPRVGTCKAPRKYLKKVS